MWPAGPVCLRCISYGLFCGFGPRVAEIQAQLTAAEFNLEETVVRAPTDGYVTQLALRPGMMAVPLPLRPVMVFVHDEERYFLVHFGKTLSSASRPVTRRNFCSVARVGLSG